MFKNLHVPFGRKHKKELFSLTSSKHGKRAHTHNHNENRYDTSIVADSAGDFKSEKVNVQPEATEIQGMRFVGFTKTQMGKVVPLYEPVKPAEGKLDINTFEGWNALTMKNIERRLIGKLGRMPTEAEKKAQLDADRRLARREMRTIRSYLECTRGKNI